MEQSKQFENETDSFKTLKVFTWILRESNSDWNLRNLQFEDVSFIEEEYERSVREVAHVTNTAK